MSGESCGLGSRSLPRAREGHQLVKRFAVPPSAAEAEDALVWQEAAAAERERTQLLLQKLAGLQDVLGGSRLEEEAQEARRVLDEGTAGDDGAFQAESFERLRACNQRLEEGIQGLETIASKPSEAYEFGKSTRLTGLDVTVDVLPPVWNQDDPALVPGAPHVRVSLPLDEAGALMWGSDLTPFFDDEGARLIAFHASIPLGMRIGVADRPAEAPEAPGQVIVVQGVGERSEAERLGIQAGDYLRAVSFLGDGIEPDPLNAFLGAKAVPLKEVLKCDTLSIEE